MNTIKELIAPEWGGTPYLKEYWDVLDQNERNEVMLRIDDLFKDGLPFELEHDKILYAHIFSMLAFLEIAGLRINYKFQSQCKQQIHRKQMRAHFIDEIVHALIFTKLAYQLSLPYGMPPNFDDRANNLCAFFSSQEDAAIGFTLGAVIGEGFIEAIFSSLKEHGVAHRVFEVIVQDEQRHMSDAEIYEIFGPPNQKELKHQLSLFEDIIITGIWMQDQFTLALNIMLGTKGYLDLLDKNNLRYTEQLHSLKLKPGKQYIFSLDLARELSQERFSQYINQTIIPLSPTRRLCMNNWKEPQDPTMSSTFNINITALNFFEKKYPPELINCLMLQTVSLFLFELPLFRHRMCNHQIVLAEQLDVALAVTLPECGDQLSAVTFNNCHLMDVREISERLYQSIELMTYSYHKAQELHEIHPHLKKFFEKKSYELINAGFAQIRLGQPFISVSNIGHWGYENIKSPLFPGEPFKFTLGKIERKQVWNNTQKSFEIQDILPVSISVDHRVFDGNTHVPKLISERFYLCFERFLKKLEQPYKKNTNILKLDQFKQAINILIEEDLEVGYQLLFASSILMDANLTIPNSLNPDEVKKHYSTI